MLAHGSKFCHSYNTWNVLCEYSKILMGSFFITSPDRFLVYSLSYCLFFLLPISLYTKCRLTPGELTHHICKPTQTTATLLGADFFPSQLTWARPWPSQEQHLVTQKSPVKHWLFWITWAATERQSDLQHWHRCHRPVWFICSHHWTLQTLLVASYDFKLQSRSPGYSGLSKSLMAHLKYKQQHLLHHHHWTW